MMKVILIVLTLVEYLLHDFVSFLRCGIYNLLHLPQTW